MVEVGDEEGRVTLALEPEMAEYAQRVIDALELIEDTLSDAVSAWDRIADTLEAAFKVEEEKDGDE